jgi:hypothetical protein
MKTLKQLMSAAILSILASTAVAQTTETSPNLITNTWNNVTTGTHPNDCCTGGPSPLYDPNTNTIHFSYGNTAVHQVIGINTALQGTGIQINGWNWGYDLRNMNGTGGGQSGTDTINVTSFITNNAGQIVKQSDQYYNTQFDWTRFTGTENLNSAILLENNVNLGIQFVARDGGFWAGYYGPQVRNVSLTANYTVDQCSVNPQSSPTCPGYKTYYNMWDDGFARVDLPFAFPFYGQLYTTSYMYTNGVVGFLNNNWGFCCDGTDLNGQVGTVNSPWNYSIYALNTDLIPGPNSEFYTQVTDNGTGLKYSWVNVPEIGTDLNNTFHVQIKDSGYIGITYDQVNLNPWRNPLIGIAGDISKGEYSQYYFGQASGLPNLAGTTLTYTGTETTDICSINPLYNASCPGYASAYFNQQCSINPLYDSSCAGYAQAYFTQQCSANPLYDVNCPGYATAYLDYQCSQNPLYSTTCPGYEQAYLDQQCTADPLYSTQCSGYQQAYFDQQCGLNGLYSTQCPNYADAYYVQQCTISPLYDSGCTGYAEAYFSQQCSLDPLYNNQCPGYATAYFNQQCSISALYNNQCPGYAEAYFSQQCSLDGLYDKQCPNYAEAYAKKNILNVGNTSPTNTTTTTETQSVAVVTTSSDPVASAAPVVADPVVNQAITTTATSASPAAAATATVPLVSAPAATTTTTTVAAAAETTKEEPKKEETKTADSSSSEEKKEETKTADSSTSSSSTTTASSGTASKDQPKTTRQALAERRLEAARSKAIEDGKQLAGKMGEAASMEAQVQVQAVVVAAMSFVPGFDRYGQVTLPDVVGYKPFEIYKGQRNVDNPAGRRFLTGADARHQEMVDQQYTRRD